MASFPSQVSFPFPTVSDERELSEVFGLLYGELRRMAGCLFQNERPDHTLQPTALVHELFIRWKDNPPKEFVTRAHFFGVAARAMREILVEWARHTKTLKQGGHLQRIAPEEIDLAMAEAPDYEVIDQAVRALEIDDRQAGQIAALHIFGGLSTTEISEILGMGASTVRREWTFAKKWLENWLKAHAL
jgi:RNA polymerase sigma factor (TIGR02999 family)